MLPESAADFPELKRAWARARIDELLEQSASGASMPHKVRQEVIGLALEYRLVTPFTAFTALDPEVVNPNGEMLAIAVAQPLPEGLDRVGFFPPAPQTIAQAGISMPAMPRMTGSKRVSEDSSARKKAVDNELYQKRVSPSANIAPDPVEFLTSPPSTGRSMILAGSSEKKDDDSTEILRWLARTQNLNGSWMEDVELTAAALLAFIRQGQTNRLGYYRKQVTRAAAWLLRTTCVGTPAFIRAFALYELASVEPKLAPDQQINTILSQLATAKTPLEHIIQTLLSHSGTSITGPQKITDLESLRVASVLNVKP